MSRRERLRDLAVDALVEEWPLIVERCGVPHDTCVTAATAGAVALRELGFRARPLPVKAWYSNAAAIAMHEEGVDPVSEDWHRIGAERGAYEMVAGFSGPIEGRYDGHMVVLVDGRVAADPSARQFHKPDRGLVVGPMRFDVDRSFLGGETVAVALPDGARAHYYAVPGDTAWTKGHYDGWGRDVLRVGSRVADHLRRAGARDLAR